MYSIVFHAHQKLDKAAYEVLIGLKTPKMFFPKLDDIINFEGKNGPDSTKLKRYVSDNIPWHFIDPHKESDKDLISAIDYHYTELVKSLKKKDEIRSAFEAAWLAHALVDGLTPAHHWPYADELERVHGSPAQNRKGIVGRAYVKTGNLSQSINKSLQLIGPKGIVTKHAMFEAGAYFITAPMKLAGYFPEPDELKLLSKSGVIGLFKHYLKDVAALNLYERYNVNGWNKELRSEFKKEVLPRMIQMVSLAWYAACLDAKRGFFK